MAITATFALQNVPINADTVRQAIASLQPDGPGGLVAGADLAVTQTSVASMGVSVAAGRAWLEGTDSAHLSGQTYGKQGKYFVLNDAPYTVSIDTADGTNPRIDVIYVAVQDAMYAGSNNQAVIAVAKGIPASGATYPTNATALPTNSIALAWVNVPAGAASITNTNITSLAKRAWPQPITSDFGNGNSAPIVKSGTIVVNTDANGFAGYLFPTPFPTVMSSCTITECTLQTTFGAIIVKYSFDSSDKTRFRCYLYAANGAVLANATGVRLAYFATGY